MQSADPNTAHSYRWVILTLILLTNVSAALVQLSGASAQLAVASEFGLTAAQTATWVNLPLLTIALFSIPAGMGVDYFGARKGVAAGLLCLALFGLARGWAPSFTLLCVTTFLFGLGQALTLSGMPKAVLEWFPPSQIGLAVGTYTSGAAIGVIAVFLIAPTLFLNDWRGLFIATGSAAAVVCVAWLFLGRSGPGSLHGGESAASPGQMVASLMRVASQKDVLVLMGICACTQIGIFSWLVFGFPFLVLAKGATQQAAGAVLSVTMVGFLVGALSVAPLSDRLGRRRPFILVSGVLSGGLLLLVYFLPLGPLLWAAVFLIGCFFAVLQLLLFAIPLELKAVSKQEVGACEGLIISFGFLAAIFISPILGKIVGDFQSADAGDFLVVLGLLASVMMVGAGLALGLTETGWKSGSGTAERATSRVRESS